MTKKLNYAKPFVLGILIFLLGGAEDGRA